MKRIAYAALLAGAVPLLGGCAGKGPAGGPAGNAAKAPAPPPLDKQEPPEIVPPEAVMEAGRKPGAWLRLRSVGRDSGSNTVAEVDAVYGGRVTKACVLTIRRGPRMNPGYAVANPARLARGAKVGRPVRLVRKGGTCVVLPARKKA